MQNTRQYQRHKENQQRFLHCSSLKPVLIGSFPCSILYELWMTSECVLENWVQNTRQYQRHKENQKRFLHCSSLKPWINWKFSVFHSLRIVNYFWMRSWELSAEHQAIPATQTKPAMVSLWLESQFIRQAMGAATSAVTSNSTWQINSFRWNAAVPIKNQFSLFWLCVLDCA